jgi:hypothetical protein
MRVQEMWKFVHPRLSYSPRAFPSGNMILPPTFSCLRTITLAGKPARLPREWNMIFISRNMIFVLCDHVFWFLPIDIYSMRVQEMWKFVHPRLSYSPRAFPSGNMILLGEYISYFSHQHAINVYCVGLYEKQMSYSKAITFYIANVTIQKIVSFYSSEQY